MELLSEVEEHVRLLLASLLFSFATASSLPHERVLSGLCPWVFGQVRKWLAGWVIIL